MIGMSSLVPPMITEEDLRRDIADWNTARETLDRGSLATELKSDRVNCSDVCVVSIRLWYFFLVVKYTNQRLITQGPLHTISAIWLAQVKNKCWFSLLAGLRRNDWNWIVNGIVTLEFLSAGVEDTCYAQVQQQPL